MAETAPNTHPESILGVAARYIHASDAYDMAVERALAAITMLEESARLEAHNDDSREKLLNNAGFIETVIRWIEAELQAAWNTAHPAQENGGAA